MPSRQNVKVTLSTIYPLLVESFQISNDSGYYSSNHVRLNQLADTLTQCTTRLSNGLSTRSLVLTTVMLYPG